MDMNRFSEDCLAWQLFLRSKGWKLAADGICGDHTRGATAEFQVEHGLRADGLLGGQTLKAASSLGFRPASWPARPTFAPLSAAGRRQLFGAFKFVDAPVEGNPEAIRILGDWEERNIVRVQLPGIEKVTGGPRGGVRFHRLAAEQLKTLWQRWDDAGLLDRVLTWDGSFVARRIRGSRSISMHAYGTAFDINCNWNGLGTRPALLFERGCVRELVQIAVQHGFYWGGWFSRRDGMHFEVREIKR